MTPASAFHALAVFFVANRALATPAPRLLIYQKNGKGFVHDNLAASAAALRQLGTENGSVRQSRHLFQFGNSQETL